MSDPSKDSPSVDWPKFYAVLSGLSVAMPEFAPGESADLGELRRVLLEVQVNRDNATRILNSILQKLANAKRLRDIARTTIKVEEITFANDPEVVSIRSASERRQHVQELLLPTITRLGFLEARVSELAVAKEAVEATLRTLETAKETINAIHRQSVAELERL